MKTLDGCLADSSGEGRYEFSTPSSPPKDHVINQGSFLVAPVSLGTSCCRCERRISNTPRNPGNYRIQFEEHHRVREPRPLEPLRDTGLSGCLTIELTTRLAHGLAPILIAGGAMRALEDASVLGPAAVRFITPSIYIGIAGVTCAAHDRRGSSRSRFCLGSCNRWHTRGAWALLAGWALQYGMTTAETFRPRVPVLMLGIAITVTGGLYFVGAVTGWVGLQRPMYMLLVFGQMWDAAQNLVGVTLLGSSPKIFVTEQVYQWPGFSGSTFLPEILEVIGAIRVFADGEDDLPDSQWWLIAMVVIIVGLPMAVRGTIRTIRGV